jgi:hypothetical protein
MLLMLAIGFVIILLRRIEKFSEEGSERSLGIFAYKELATDKVIKKYSKVKNPNA